MTHRSDIEPSKCGVLEVERWLDALYVAADGASLRDEERRKARQVSALLAEIERCVARSSRREPFLLVDAAAGKSYLGLLAAKLVLEASGRPARVVTIEHVPERVAASERARLRLGADVSIECRQGDVADLASWPRAASLVVALHACGPAADAIIDQSVASGAKALLLVPCCTGRGVAAVAVASADAERRGIPRQAPVRQRYLQALVDAERTWRLEAAGFETEVVEFVGAIVTPHNLLFRARHVGEPVRSERARRRLESWRQGFGQFAVAE